VIDQQPCTSDGQKDRDRPKTTFGVGKKLYNIGIQEIDETRIL